MAKKVQDRTNVKSERVTILFNPIERRALEMLADEQMGTMSEFNRNFDV